MSEVNKLRELDISVLASKREQLLRSLQAVENDMSRLLEEQGEQIYRPLTQDAISQMLESHKGQLSVREICLIAGISPTSYYNIVGKINTVNVGMLQTVLNTLGLNLYVGLRGVLQSEPDFILNREAELEDSVVQE